MARNALTSKKRFKRIHARQWIVRWRAEYRSAMLATRDEAPKTSHPSTLYCAKLGRDLRFMSLAERHGCLLALYHPRVFDMHEQHALTLAHERLIERATEMGLCRELTFGFSTAKREPGFKPLPPHQSPDQAERQR